MFYFLVVLIIVLVVTAIRKSLQNLVMQIKRQTDALRDLQTRFDLLRNEIKTQNAKIDFTQSAPPSSTAMATPPSSSPPQPATPIKSIVAEKSTAEQTPISLYIPIPDEPQSSAPPTPLPSAPPPAKPTQQLAWEARPAPLNQPSNPPSNPPPPHVEEVSKFERFVASAFARAKEFALRDGHFWMIAGGIILFIGATFLVRHSMRMGWISPAMRLGGVALLGLALAAIGVALKSRRRIYALLLQGCGLSLMYLSAVGAARGAEKLIGPETALAALSALVVATAALALWQNAQMLAHIAVVAGFVAPLLVSSPDAGAAGLFAFYLLLDTGILAMSYVRPWRRLYLTGFTLTFGIFSTWTAAEFSQDLFWQSYPFLAAYFLLYVFMGLRALPAAGVERTRRISTDVTLTLLAPLFFLSLSLRMVEARYGLPAIFAACGAMYGALGWALRGRGRGITTLLRTQALICLNLALPLLLMDARPALITTKTMLALTWSLEAASLHICGVKFARLEQRIFGVLLFIASALACAANSLMNFDHAEKYFSPYLLCNLTLAASLLACAGTAAKNKLQRTPERFMLASLLSLFASLLLEALNMGSSDTLDGFAWFLLASSIAALLLALAAKRAPSLMLPAFGRAAEDAQEDAQDWYTPPVPDAPPASMLELAWLFHVPAALALGLRYCLEWISINPDLAAIAATRPNGLAIAAWLAFFGAQYFVLSRHAPKAPQRSSLADKPAWRALYALLALAFLAQMLMTASAKIPAIDPLFAHFIGRLFAPALLAFLLLAMRKNSAQNSAQKYARRADAFLRGDGAGGVSNLLPLSLCVACLAQLPAIFTLDGGIAGCYAPLLNTADIAGLAMLLAPLAALFAMRRRDDMQTLRALCAAAWCLAFVWVNVLVGRIAHHYCGVAYACLDIWRNDSFQTISAFVWGALGIGSMIYSYRRGFRLPWVMGAALVIADVVKLFIIDLSQLAAIPRIISFIAVGLLLLMVGYFAPLPPQGKSRL